MMVGRVIGHGTSTVKHRSLVGVKLLLVQPLRGTWDEPMLTLDRLGAHVGDTVLISSDGESAREAVQDPTSPARWSVIAIADNAETIVIPGRASAGGTHS
ncbi:MAG: EutN/CcmL family microcompartment protein [Planctomycetota bacterium]